MFSQKQQSKIVIKVSDSELSYISLRKNKLGFFIDQFETIELPEGIIKDGEILKADIFSKLLKKIEKKLINKHINILLPHESFLCNAGTLKNSEKKIATKIRIKEYLENISETENWQKTHVHESEIFHFGIKDRVLFTCLSKDIQKSYVHVFKKSGLKVDSLNSELLAFGHMFDADFSSVIFVNQNVTRIVDFRKGMYIADKTFQVSYQQLIENIIKSVHSEHTYAENILVKYGILRTHRDPQVYKRIMRSFGPLFDFFKKSKSKNESSIALVYSRFPLLGLADAVSQTTHTHVHDFNVFGNKNYVFEEVLSLHKNESYAYQPHIAQALKLWKNN
jgi:Tfp pilus assembly PilM family ATPase